MSDMNLILRQALPRRRQLKLLSHSHWLSRDREPLVHGFLQGLVRTEQEVFVKTHP